MEGIEAATGSAAGAPRVTVSLVTHDGLGWLPGCLDSLRRQTLTDYELLVVDSASADGSVDWLREQASGDARIRVDVSPQNVGFAAGHNRSIYRARGELVCLLNQDVELDEHFLEEAVRPFAERPRVAAVQGRLRRMLPGGERTHSLDSTGLLMLRSRRAISRGQGEEDGPRFDEPGPVWGADGPAPVYRLAALLEVQEPRTGGGWEVLDEDFFMYKEDVDLAWRLTLFGWQAWYQPTALAWHGRSAAAGRPASVLDVIRSNRRLPRWIKSISWRNQRLMQIKNERPTALLRDLPWIAGREVASLGFMLIADPRRLAAIRDTWRLAPAARRKRLWLGSKITPQ